MITVRKTSFSDDHSRLTVGLANLHAVVGDIDANRNKILYALARFKEVKVNMAVFPEFCFSGYFWDDPDQCRSYMDQATLENQSVWLQENLESMLNDTLQYVVLNGLLSNSKPGKPYLNSTLVIQKESDYFDLKNTYLKTCLPGIENDYCESGGGKRLILNTPWGKFGLITCYDLCFPPIMHAYAIEDNVDGIIVIASWRRNSRRTYPGLGIETKGYYAYHWKIMLPGMAAMNQTWMIACNAVGRHSLSDNVFCGCSGLWAPSGINLARCSEDSEELLIIRNINIKGERDREKQEFDYFADYRKFIGGF